ncbi:hypothetical protein LUU34_01425000 [Aix galericulata]|nr:hypothetical protein LUU34_01425000 [Aix galericulata]
MPGRAVPGSTVPCLTDVHRAGPSIPEPHGAEPCAAAGLHLPSCTGGSEARQLTQPPAPGAAFVRAHGPAGRAAQVGAAGWGWAGARGCGGGPGVGQVPLHGGLLAPSTTHTPQPAGPSVAVRPRHGPRRRPGAPDPHGAMAGRASIPSLRACRRRPLGQGSGAAGAAPVLTVKPPAGPRNASVPWHRDSAPTPGVRVKPRPGSPRLCCGQCMGLRLLGLPVPMAQPWPHRPWVRPCCKQHRGWGRDDGGGRRRAEGFAWGGKLLGGGWGAGAGSLNGFPQGLGQPGPQCCSCRTGAPRTQGDALMVRPGPVLGMLVPGPELGLGRVSPALSIQHPSAVPGAKFTSKHSGGEGGEAARVAFCRAAGDWGTGAQ